MEMCPDLPLEPPEPRPDREPPDWWEDYWYESARDERIVDYETRDINQRDGARGMD